MNRTTNLVCSIIELVFLIALLISQSIRIFNDNWSFFIYLFFACVIALIVLDILDLMRPKSNRRLALTIFIAAIGFVFLQMFYVVDFVCGSFHEFIEVLVNHQISILAPFFKWLLRKWYFWLETLSSISIIVLSVIKLKAPAKPPASIKQTPVSIKPNQTDIVNKLTEYKELLDMGAITEEEFDAKKKQLLGL